VWTQRARSWKERLFTLDSLERKLSLFSSPLLLRAVHSGLWRRFVDGSHDGEAGLTRLVVERIPPSAQTDLWNGPWPPPLTTTNDFDRIHPTSLSLRSHLAQSTCPPGPKSAPTLEASSGTRTGSSSVRLPSRVLPPLRSPQPLTLSLPLLSQRHKFHEHPSYTWACFVGGVRQSRLSLLLD
jgi:hypothetical protein